MMNVRTRFLAVPHRIALLVSLLFLGLMIKPEPPATLAEAARHGLTSNGGGLRSSDSQPLSIRLAAAAFMGDRASPAQPNHFDLQDMAGHTHIIYSTSGVDGRPHLDYTDPRLHRSYAGKEIRVLPSEIGALVSVDLEQVPDLHTITLTLLVPTINLRTTRASLLHQGHLDDAAHEHWRPSPG